MEMTLEYWNTLANQTILISSLLSGFSITIVANFLVSSKMDKINNRILKFSTLSAGCFLVAVFAMMQIAMITTPGGYHYKDVTENSFLIPRIIGLACFVIGLFSLAGIISLAGWTRSKRTGIFTTIVAIATLILIFLTMIRIEA